MPDVLSAGELGLPAGVDLVVSDRCPKGMMFVGRLDAYAGDPASVSVIVDRYAAALLRFRLDNRAVWDAVTARLDALDWWLQGDGSVAATRLAEIRARLG